MLEEFLQIPRKTPKAAPVELDVVPAEAEKPEVGKLEGGDAPAEATSEEVPMETDKIGYLNIKNLRKILLYQNKL